MLLNTQSALIMLPPDSGDANGDKLFEGTKSRVYYSINFPPGPMGLELEPVIKSSEREIGCRVKDYYYSVNHYGIDPAYLESQVAIGDIICSVNDLDVKSMPFKDIVERLRSLRDMDRTVAFKNITAACKLLCLLLLFGRKIHLITFSFY